MERADSMVDDPRFGAPTAVRGLVDALFRSTWCTCALTWSVIAIELTIAGSMLLRRSRRLRIGFSTAACLHVAIIAGMGLVSFGMTMIALMLCACAEAFPWAGNLLEAPKPHRFNSREISRPCPASQRPAEEAVMNLGE